MRSIACAALLLLAACGPARVLPPASAAPIEHGDDAGATAILRDHDAGSALDAGESLDAGPSIDAGEPVDAGEAVDAGEPLDAGHELDAGSDFDAGSELDAGPADAGFVLDLDAGPSSTRQTERQLGSTSAPNGFLEYLPPGYGDGAPRPLMVFWHGIGEDGNGTTDLSKVTANGPPKLIARDQWPSDRPFIVLSPQNPWGCPSSQEISDFINWARANYDIDPQRVYLTGLSCGAIGSWQYLGDHTEDGGIAAALFSSGDPGDPTQSWSTWGMQGCQLGRIAIWAVHGTADGTVNINNEENTMNDLVACTQRRDAIWMPIDGGGHNVWDDLYAGNDGDVYGWLLANTLQ